VPQVPRVVIVTSRLDVGGTERHLARIVPELRRRGIDISLYLMERGGTLEAGLSAQGVPIEGRERRRFLHWPRAMLQLAGFLRRETPDIVHFFLPRPYIYGSLAAELAGHRRRIMSRRSLTDYQSAYPLLGSVERFLHRRTFGVIGNSKSVVHQLLGEVAVAGKVGLLHNGVDLPATIGAAAGAAARRSLEIADDAFVIVVVANLVAYKGHRDLIEALGRVRHRLPKPWTLLLIGRDDGIGGGLKQQAAALNISSNILWLGERSDVGNLLAASQIFVLPSHQEGFSNALLEAMAAGVPPVATAVGGNVDAVADNENGILVPPHDSEALGLAISRLASDQALRGRLADAAHQRVSEHFSLAACVERYERLYRALMEPTPPPVSEILADDCGDCEMSGTAAKIEHAR
jgi:glycosyltransferase involved in cell wall biosynthesis